MKAGAQTLITMSVVFGASDAQAIDFKPSPDGQFQNCVASADLPQTLEDMGQRAVASWDTHKTEPLSTNGKTMFLKGLLSVDIAGANAQKKWITWSGWDHNIPANGTKPELFYASSNGKGISVTSDNKLPVSPFGYNYTTPPSPLMGGGKVFYKDLAKGHIARGSYPVILTNVGNKSFMAFYIKGDDLDIEATNSTGATHDTVTASNFKLPDRIMAEIAESEH